MSHRLHPFSPARYHGTLSSRPYFEGWYFKHTSKDGAFVVIPGIFRGSEDKEDIAFIQLIYGSPPKSRFVSYPISAFACHPRRFEMVIGSSRFSEKQIHLDIPEIGLSADLKYSEHIPLKTSLLSPTVMGPFSYLPKMQCCHGVLSLWHSVTGSVRFDDKQLIFNNADGYVEKDWGEEFPQSWIWMQCGSGKQALMCAIARIPLKTFRFTGVISVLQTGDRQLRFATYNGAKVLDISSNANGITVEIKRGKLRLCIIARAASFGSLMAPSKQGMIREIRESVNCRCDISLCRGTQTIYSSHFENGGLEILEPQLLTQKQR